MAHSTQPLVRGKSTGVVVPNAFIGRTAKPTDDELAAALGPAKPLWDGLVGDLAAEHGVADAEWSSYSPKAGWSLRMKRGKRTIVWLSPHEGCFQVTFILGGKAVAAARECGLPARILKALDEAPKYPEGTGLRLLVKGPRDIPAIGKLAAVKLLN